MASNRLQVSNAGTLLNANTDIINLLSGLSGANVGTQQVNVSLNLNLTGDVTGTNAGSSLATTLKSTGTAGTYKSVTTDAQGRVTAGTNPTTLAAYGITDSVKNVGSAPSLQTGTHAARPAPGTVGALYIETDSLAVFRDNGASWDNVTVPALTGDVTSPAGSQATTLATVNGNVGTWGAVTVNAKGLVTAGVNATITGDITGTAAGSSMVATLAASGVTAGAYSSPPKITVDAKGRVTAILAGPIEKYVYYAANFENPNNSDWIMNTLAPAQNDATYKSLIVRGFDDTAEQGIGFYLTVPATATNIIFAFKSRAATAPTVAKQVVLRLYNRHIPNNATVGAWSAAKTLTAIDIAINAFYQYDSQTQTLASLSVTAGDLYLFELTRQGGAVADTLVGNYLLAEMQVSFT